ncbi:MAG: hypothetical protein H5U06_08785 [Candidatus Aminicenantes bacterium]|nr:hypothetical protein [Candidatus Aminicenantes bacterium]
MGARPVYLVIDDEGKLSDLGDLSPLAFSSLSPGSQWRLFINLSLPPSDKN